MRRDHIRRLSSSPLATGAFGEHALPYLERTSCWTVQELDQAGHNRWASRDVACICLAR